MKTVIVVLAVLLSVCACFAGPRSILVMVIVQKDGPPTASIYSGERDEARLNTSIAEAAAVLEKAGQPADTLFVSLLVSGFMPDEPVWELLDGLKKNHRAELDYLEIDRSHVAGLWGGLSKRGKELRAAFKGAFDPPSQAEVNAAKAKVAKITVGMMRRDVEALLCPDWECPGQLDWHSGQYARYRNVSLPGYELRIQYDWTGKHGIGRASHPEDPVIQPPVLDVIYYEPPK